MGLLLGVNTYLRSPSTVIPVEFVPEQTVILEEERLPPEIKPTIGEQISTKKALEIKSQTSTRATIRPETNDMIRPAPKKSRLEPRLTINQAPLLDVPPVQEERERSVRQGVGYLKGQRRVSVSAIWLDPFRGRGLSNRV